jgi:hypothetical protein
MPKIVGGLLKHDVLDVSAKSRTLILRNDCHADSANHEILSGDDTMKSNLLALTAAVIGGIVGCLAFLWITKQGFYALVLPGGLVGIAASQFKSRSVVVCGLCGLLALAFGLYAEWKFAPFLKDAGLGYFLTHVYLLRPITLIMIGVGVVLGFWLPFRHRNDVPVTRK